jgi:hypothetical protein
MKNVYIMYEIQLSNRHNIFYVRSVVQKEKWGMNTVHDLIHFKFPHLHQASFLG